MNKSVYHGGGAIRPGYAMGGGGGVPISSEFYTSVIHCNSGEIDVSVNVPAPSDGLWNDNRQGWYFGVDYSLKEIHLLYNEFRTNSVGETISLNFRRRLADGAGGAFVSVYTITTTFPNSGSSYWPFFGDHADSLDILIPAGYYVYVYCTGRVADDVEGVSIWAQYQKEPV